VVTPKGAPNREKATKVVSSKGEQKVSQTQLKREAEEAETKNRLGNQSEDDFDDIQFVDDSEAVRKSAMARNNVSTPTPKSAANDINWNTPARARSVASQQSGNVPMYDDNTAASGNLPSLVVTNDPPPSIIYRRDSRDTVLDNDEANLVRRDTSIEDAKIETAVTAKARELYRDMKEAERKYDIASKKYETLKNRNNVEISEYYSLVANINAALRTGTTPGNPILVDRWNAAQSKLNDIPKNVNLINNLAVDLSSQASRVSYLQEAITSAFNLSGAVDADHVTLRKIEDRVDQMVTDLNRMILQVNKEMNRIDALLKTESANMQTLSLGIANGELYGESLANNMQKKTWDTVAKMTKPEPERKRKPLVIIRFDKPNIDYERPLYKAVSAALDKYPSARFTLLAMSPMNDNKAKEAIDKKEARNYADNIMDSLVKMGLPASRINVEASVSDKIESSEIHIFLK